MKSHVTQRRQTRNSAAASRVLTGETPSLHPAARIAGYLLVGGAVAAGVAMWLAPKWFGLEGMNPAPAIGLSLLAGFRLWALQREARRQGGA